MQGFIIAGTNSGCGKTTVTIGLMALLKFLNKKVAPFKTGPDYIDPLFHGKVLGVPSYNLDSYMLSESAIKYLYHKHSQHMDISIVEGVMGMYDGMGNTAVGSTFELSQLLNLPVLLVVNCKGLYQSVVAIIKGFLSLKPKSNIKGVILNQVASENNYLLLKKLIEKECPVSCVGYVISNKDFALESRHLGLVQAEEVDGFTKKVEILKESLKNTIDIKGLLELSRNIPEPDFACQLPDMDLSDLKIGVAYDKAFRFYYQDNLELLESLGASLYYFSPLNSSALPPDCNCLYIGGGYPEVFAKELAENKALMIQIRQAVEKGLPVYGECGGLMYLTQYIIDSSGHEHPMCGVFNTRVQMTQRLQRFGYALAEYEGVSVRCHEFHRSKLVSGDEQANYTYSINLNKPDKQQSWHCGLKLNNCLAAYAHVHFYANLNFFNKIVELWRRASI